MSGILKSFSRSAPVASRALQQRGQALPPIISRTYASSAVPDQSSNISNPQASSAENQSINHSASIGQTDKNDGDHTSI
ncbi:hypothetical protein GGP41_003470 [Bipolaris sorokiniana]|uniref:Uncharacterized protein n=1 Tax=Cochliobolus sativus TaxID=45130 RepID=A0A8H5ZFA6_COCSA|nr:hypothetical protein GGP41_003470 [Bipolaris sorokiniana]